MEDVRAEMLRSSAHLRASAQSLTDWRYYVRRYPWVALAAAGVVGFLAVPKRAKTVSPDPEALAKLAERQGLVLQPRHVSTGEAIGSEAKGLLAGLAGSLVSMAGRTLLRTGLNYVSQQVGQVLAARSAGERQQASRVSPCGERRETP